MSSADSSGWTFLTNHSHVLMCLAKDPTVRLREVAETVGITERTVQMIIQDLEHAGVVEKQRNGRRNSYILNLDRHLRHPVESHCTVGDLVDLVDRISTDA